MAEVGGGGFLGAIAGVGAAVGSFLRSFFGITARELVRLITALKNALVDISQAMVTGVWRLGRSLARALVSFARLTGLGFKRFVLWADRKFRVLEKWLKDRFAPVLQFLKKIKDHINDFYRRFVRPIIDAIEFIRSFNRILQVFHVNLLGKLDSVLARVEQRLDEPFEWARRHITELENWIDRIVTLDGFFQRLTLLRSLAHNADGLTRVFWNSQSRGPNPPARFPAPEEVTPPTVDESVDDLRQFLERDSGPFSESIDRGVSRLFEELA